MTGPASYRENQTDEVPVPLVEPPSEGDEPERPVELPTDVVSEAERILETGLEESDLAVLGQQHHASSAGFTPRRIRRRQRAARGLRRQVGVTLLVFACLAAFAHGWHVGSERSKARGAEQQEVVTDITQQEASSR